MRNLLIFFAIMSAAITLSFCKTPLDEDEVPIEEWTVTKVEFYKLLSGPFIVIKFSGPDNIANYSYYYDFALNDHFSFTEIISVSGVKITGADATLYEIGINVAQGTDIPAGTTASFYQGYFYKVESNYGQIKVRAKVKITTQSFPIGQTGDGGKNTDNFSDTDT